MIRIHDERELSDLSEGDLRAKFGSKSAGILKIPIAWRPRSRFLSVEAYEAFVADGEAFERQIASEEVFGRLRRELARDVVVRSSAVSETLSERGRFLSLEANLEEPKSFVDAVIEIFEHYDGSSGNMSVLIQERVGAERKGFLSNERRVADKPYRWLAEIESKSRRRSKRPISAKQSKAFPIDQPLSAHSPNEMLSRLRAVARHFWKSSPQRTVLEWCWDGACLWLVQRDLESTHPGGKDPSSFVPKGVVAPTREDGLVFRRFRHGTATEWKKLRVVADFAIDGEAPPHRLFYATAGSVSDALDRNEAALRDEIRELTGDRCVIRTDTVPSGFNLPRTNTLTAAGAVAWLVDQVRAWHGRGQALETVLFILHAYIPARAAAWAYYGKNDPHIQVDGLWGLADGMQYYPCDTYIHDKASAEEISRNLRFKKLVLLEQPDGSWVTESVDDRKARFRALTRQETQQIASATKAIGERLNENVQIMWFVGVPRSLSLGCNLPWYMEKPASLQARKTSKAADIRVVKTVGDLDALRYVSGRSFNLALEPEGENLRSDEFIESIADFCRTSGASVELRGSILSHAYHQLSKAGVQVFTAEPAKRVVFTRAKKSFDKLVRDDIPQFIAGKGESVRAERLDPEDLREALVGKLIEETGEYLRAKGESALEELSDMFEVIRGMCNVAGVHLSAIEAIADRKAGKRGGFNKGVILRSTEVNKGAATEPRLFDLRDDPRRVRFHSLTPGSPDLREEGIPIPYLLTGKARELTLKMGKEIAVTLRIGIEAGFIRVEVVNVDIPSQLRLL